MLTIDVRRRMRRALVRAGAWSAGAALLAAGGVYADRARQPAPDPDPAAASAAGPTQLNPLLVRRASTGHLLDYEAKSGSGFLASSDLGTAFSDSTALTVTHLSDGGAGQDFYSRVGATLYFTAERGNTTKVIGSGWDQYNLIEATGNLAGAAERDLIARGGDGTLWMYMCRTDGTMTARVHVATGWNTLDQVLAPGDVTGDGKTDVLARDGSSGTLWIYPGTGSQTADAVLGTPVSAGTGWGSYTALWSTGDNTGDGKSDLLAADAAGALWLFPGTGSSSAPFGARTQVGTGFTFLSQRGPSLPTGSAGEATSKARWADFDGDGRADAITIDTSGPVRVFANRGGDGHGGWLDLGEVASGGTTDASRVRFADYDGDGRTDYIVLNTDGSVHAWLNKGGNNRGGWTDLGVVAPGTTTDATRVRFADYDGDHKDDYWRINADGSVEVWLNKGTGSWSAQGVVASGTTTDIARLRLADFDGDHKDDYWRINADGSVDLWLNKGGGSWSAQGTVASGTTTVADRVRMADFDADGKADFYTVGTDKSATVHLNHGANSWASLGLVVTPV